MTTQLQRRRLLQAIATLTSAAAAGSLALPAFAQTGKPVLARIGYQKSSTLLTVLKANGTLEKLLAPLNVKISWHEFSSGLPLLEALNVGGVDLSADVADTVPVFAQAAGAKLTYVAQEAPSPSAQAIVVRADSPIRTVADLKRKKIAVTKAAGVHYLLIATLEKAGLKFSDIDAAYLTPADGRAAFERGSVDAWVTWDPFLAGVQKQTQVRILSDGRNVADYQRYYLASTPFAEAHPDVLAIVFDELKKTGLWVRQNPKEAAAFLAPIWGLDAPTIELANSRRSYDVRAVVVNALGEQQRIADAFFAAGLLPKKVNATDVSIWKPA
ncbi:MULTISPECIES: aliphatic sulfonate ABC transporter substrate-binding protein [unclassified Herbaspirillum]|uniref:aliphatic sulfonate ABC transporter substrate-binding protein n=1 Tax=unclassified Herbaspirillum TaxID=2624150 RepID=UPI000E2F98F1|nr:MULTISPECIES: aliphatic sulfonate ABC transporter substrate-binding protein [unclassified Herbaspirillum]RFB70689.1 aliphatic sulfonate ABC transporter substrate-binding protein [Herbaspirillum sp. 3R-3a1]TFI08791.1 aliphatic sulfonate ABC transporter substrate-binding protein [Herbaspirillum sp. 3R11]TFI15206.1 aliphatic sulfonate ABC transporter substrate-binding protein [Herbaspirillum sp. 3R-11]TFI22031.1 aliphatic sulfonate ABC transporter substrate-binding protein [Herbaspirillum sp. 3